MVGVLLLLSPLPLVSSLSLSDCFLGGTITIDGNYCVNTFTANGTFEPNNSITAEVLIVAGGGGGGWNDGGGGGAGGLNHTNVSITSGNKVVVIGVGGPSNNGGLQAYDGTNSSLEINSLTNITTKGGGGGGGYSGGGGTGRDGGSGGGGGYQQVGGAGISGQGFGGGTSTTGDGGGGGGGATASGSDGTNAGGNGGAGYTSTINGTSVCYAGGGGGGVVSTGGNAGVGTCGGGNGAKSPSAGTDGKANTGGGGGGGSNTGGVEGGHNGGSGVVIIRYNPSPITINAPLNNTSSLRNVIFNISSNSGVTLSNASLYISNKLNETKTISGLTNETIFNKNFSATGTYLWYVTVCDTGACYNSSTNTLIIENLIINSVANNVSTYETASETFTLNVTGDGSSTLTANFIYNGTSYAATKSGNDIDAIFTKTIDIPSTITAGNKSFYWNIFYGTSPTNSSIYNQTVNPLFFIICNSTINTPYLNFTFKDEETSTAINASITSSFVYYLGSGTVTKTSSHQNTTDYMSYGFCTNANTSTLYVTPTVQYYNWQSVTRSYSTSTPLTLTNTVTNKVLYLLKTSSGIYSSYQTVTPSFSIITGVLIQFTLNGIALESKTTDGSGIATFFLNPNSAYTLTASKNGYTSFSTTIYPTQSTYTITLSSTTAGNITSYNQGVNYSVNPTSSYLSNGTTYNFNVTLSSSYLTLDSWGFNISNGSTVLSTTTGTGGLGNLGNINTNFNTGNNYTNLNLNVFWTYNGTTVYATKTYTIEKLSGTGWSIDNFNTDFKSYISSGFFGLTPVGLNIIIFLIIFVTTGIIGYKFGLTSPAIISGILFVMVLIFDVILGLIYYDSSIFINKVPHIATVIMGIITFGLVIKESTSY